MEAAMAELPFEVDKRLANIHDRAMAAGLPCAWYGGLGARPPILKIRLPDGQSGMIFDINEDAADAFAQIPFEDVIILSPYVAYWNRRLNEIFATAHVGNGNRRDLWAFSAARDSGASQSESTSGLGGFDQLGRQFGLGLPPTHGSLHIRGTNSELKVGLSSPPINDPILGSNSSGITLRVEGVKSGGEQEIARLLFDVANAIFFELDAAYSITLQLVQQDTVPSLLSGSAAHAYVDLTRLPARRLARDAIALYMYARTIRGYPLLEYLTYYQVIEHCMLAFSNSDAIERIRTRLEDPSFDINDSIVLSQFLSPDRRGGRAHLTEREQVRLTMQACVTSESIKEFLESNEEVAVVVSAENRPLGAHSVRLKDGQAHLLVQVADRIYDLRCRIVHAKGDALETNRPLLPTSAEVRQLQPDLLLIRFVTQQVLRSASIPANC
jgi:hypothetical protein